VFENEALTAGLTLLLVAWFDGVRIAGPGAVLLVRSPIGHWSIRKPFRVGVWMVLWQPVGWTSVVSSVGSADAYRSRTEVRAARRLSRVQRLLMTTQLMALIAAASLIIGVPTAAWKRGPVGFAWAMAAVMFLSLVQATLVYVALARIATPLGARLKSAASCLWPFHALRASDRIIARVVEGQGITTLRRVFGDELLVETWRAPLYDALTSRGTSSEAEVLLSATGRDRVSALLEQLRAENDVRWCMRCGATYEAYVSECFDCGVPLVQ
jgi:hypothetical protein